MNPDIHNIVIQLKNEAKELWPDIKNNEWTCLITLWDNGGYMIELFHTVNDSLLKSLIKDVYRIRTVKKLRIYLAHIQYFDPVLIEKKYEIRTAPNSVAYDFFPYKTNT